MNLNAETAFFGKSQEEIYTFLSDFENFKKIMPENIDKFEITDNGFIFALKGMPSIKLKLKDRTPHSSIMLESASEQFPFTLAANISENDTNNQSKVNFNFEGKFNPMITMMVKSPLQKFIKTLSTNIEKI